MEVTITIHPGPAEPDGAAGLGVLEAFFWIWKWFQSKMARARTLEANLMAAMVFASPLWLLELAERDRAREQQEEEGELARRWRHVCQHPAAHTNNGEEKSAPSSRLLYRAWEANNSFWLFRGAAADRCQGSQLSLGSHTARKKQQKKQKWCDGEWPRLLLRRIFRAGYKNQKKNIYTLKYTVFIFDKTTKSPGKEKEK